CPLLAEAIPQVGHRQTRNQGTVGGSLSHCDPAAEIPTICAASDAVIRVQGPKGERDIPFAEFSLGFMTTAMELDEMLVSIRIPLWGEGHGYAFEEFARRHGDFAIVSAAALLTAAPDGSITRASLTIGGAGSSALRMGEAESFLVGQQAGPENFEKASEICRGIDAIGDVHAPADYRRQLAVELALRALERAWARI
ncbi:MAG: FAD binding domain-containing protein, partial [Rhodospirillales bacterium]|nr:FAD binding domain-containing protein [Rhodospirillales bacterium]